MSATRLDFWPTVGRKCLAVCLVSKHWEREWETNGSHVIHGKKLLKGQPLNSKAEAKKLRDKEGGLQTGEEKVYPVWFASVLSTSSVTEE